MRIHIQRITNISKTFPLEEVKYFISYLTILVSILSLVKKNHIFAK